MKSRLMIGRYIVVSLSDNHHKITQHAAVFYIIINQILQIIFLCDDVMKTTWVDMPECMVQFIDTLP